MPHVYSRTYIRAFYVRTMYEVTDRFQICRDCSSKWSAAATLGVSRIGIKNEWETNATEVWEVYRAATCVNVFHETSSSICNNVFFPGETKNMNHVRIMKSSSLVMCLQLIFAFYIISLYILVSFIYYTFKGLFILYKTFKELFKNF